MYEVANPSSFLRDVHHTKGFLVPTRGVRACFSSQQLWKMDAWLDGNLDSLDLTINIFIYCNRQQEILGNSGRLGSIVTS